MLKLDLHAHLRAVDRFPSYPVFRKSLISILGVRFILLQFNFHSPVLPCSVVSLFLLKCGNPSILLALRGLHR